MTDQEINEAVALKLGWRFDGKYWKYINPDPHAPHKNKFGDEEPTWVGYTSKQPPAYSTSIEAAWEIVDHLKAEHDVSITVGAYDDNLASCRIDDVEIFGPNAPTAICLAFLKLPDYK